VVLLTVVLLTGCMRSRLRSDAANSVAGIRVISSYEPRRGGVDAPGCQIA
jgi:hypothetical protein